ncbi:hypothetical protein LX59_01113 [Azomonas agilis]|uniref:Uncharacterized protein n=1 Tax=Azomonas agilis TaxID=116849 RepID=A0A562IZB8_9GAMM|nr:DUF5455 family protein [Azomonas agilis]TWH76193.1 hypothetical protein LX59_01113 [Azomonas agilis]
MQAIITALVSIFTNLASFVTKWLGIKYTIRMVVVAAWLAAVSAFLIALGVLSGNLYSSVPSWVQDALDLLPSNTLPCIAAIAAAYAASWTYTEITTLITIKGRV